VSYYEAYSKAIPEFTLGFDPNSTGGGGAQSANFLQKPRVVTGDGPNELTELVCEN
jgi:hypothetical protein